MEFFHDNDVREHALIETETILQVLRPGKKAFFFYRVGIPSAVLSLAAIVLLLINTIHTITRGVPFSGIPYIILVALTVPTILVLYSFQKLVYNKRAYYITDKRVLLGGGIYHLKYQTLGYRFIGSVTLKRTMFSKMFNLESHSISVILNVHKQFSIKFFSFTGNTLSYLEEPDEAYRQIVELSVDQ